MKKHMVKVAVMSAFGNPLIDAKYHMMAVNSRTLYGPYGQTADQLTVMARWANHTIGTVHGTVCMGTV